MPFAIKSAKKNWRLRVSNPLIMIGAPTSAGAYAPGQEKAPEAVRTAGLLEYLNARNITVDDWGDIPGFRWRADKGNLRAMNVDMVATAATVIADHVARALAEDAVVLVLGGDCTVEIGTVAGALAGTESLGLIYIDLDTDLNTPESTDDGALDWMGVAHMLGVKGSAPELTKIGPRVPLLDPDQILFFANDNSKPFERRIIEEHNIAEVKLEKVIANPAQAAQSVADGWAKRFELLLIHLDVDVLDYLDMPLAENTRRNVGLHFDQLMAALRVFLGAPNWAALTISELNPEHGESDGSTLRIFAEALADALGSSPKLSGA
jgi:arginase